jgi:hypothetical protein
MRRLYTFWLAVVSMVVLICGQPTLIMAITQSGVDCQADDTCFYDPSATACGSTTVDADTSATAPNGTNKPGSMWNSSTQPPYYMEEFIVNVLQDIAQKLNVPASDAVTQEHVVAMTAWAYAEGGNIANSGAFNLWNTGLLSRPDLVSGGTNASGLESFVSFNAGVEANAISMTDSNQNRIGKIVTQPNSTASQVLHTIAYYDETSGDQAWAWGNSPDDPNAVLQFNHTTYITSLLDNLHDTRADYAHRASVVIGPGEESTDYVAASKLQYKGGDGSDDGSGGSVTSDGGGTCGGGSTGSVDCSSATGDAKILCEAEPFKGVYYEWGGGHSGLTAFQSQCPDPTNPPNNQSSGGAVNGDPAGLSGNPSPCGVDCSGLVSIATSEAFNENYSWNVSGLQGSSDWKSIPMSSVQPGDVVTVSSVHVEIVDHYDSSSGLLYTFGAHDTGQADGEISSSPNYWSGGAFRYIGPGSGAS